MPGPLANVETLLDGISFDINRLLYMGANKTMQFVVPDEDEPTGIRVVLTLTKNFDRVQDEEGSDYAGGSDVIYKVADISNQLPTVLAMQELHVIVDGLLHRVSSVPDVGTNEAQTYTLYCRTRTIRTSFFDKQ